MVIKDGKEVPKAKYKYCGKIYIAESTRGTMHLLRYKKKCDPKHIVGTKGEGCQGHRPRFLLLVAVV